MTTPNQRIAQRIADIADQYAQLERATEYDIPEELEVVLTAAREAVDDTDALHQVVKVEDVPAYQRFGAPGQEVYSSRARFEALPEVHKLQAVLEESYVLALERSQIPFPGTSPHVSFRTALEKVCTSITSGWFREYAWENYFAVLTMYSPSYVDRFNEARPTLKELHGQV